MSWIFIAVIAYLILAVVNLADKFLLEKFVPSAQAYTFLVGILSLLAFLAAPWFLSWPGWTLLGYNLLVGAMFPVALLLLYKALKEGEASRMITLVGGAIPVFTIILSLSVLNETFSGRQWLALVLLILGTVLISWFPTGHDLWDKVKSWFALESFNQRLGMVSAISAAFILAVFFIGSKYLYLAQDFMSAFIWIRLGTGLMVLTLLLPREYRQEISKSFRKIKNGRGRIVFFATQFLAAGGFILQNYALSLGSVALVNALQGVQYGFLLILGALLSVFYPRLLKEAVSRNIIIKKILAILMIAAGLYLIAV